MLLFKSLPIWQRRLKDIVENKEKSNKNFAEFFQFLSGGNFIKRVQKEAEDLLKGDILKRKSFLTQSILNCQDEFGNTMLHLATLNEKKEMFDRLIELGADPMLRNNDGLTAFTLSVRFSLWGMFHHIWNRHFSKTYWSFGNLAANFVDYQQFEAVSNGVGAFGSVHEIDRCINALVYGYIQNPGNNANKTDNHKYPRNNDDHTKHQEQIEHSISSHCQRKLSSYLSYLNNQDRGIQRESQIVGMQVNEERLQYKSHRDAKSAVQLITHFRPEGWYANTKELMEEVVSLKWSHGYYLVHIADSLIPFCVIILIFCLMWWQRQLNVLEHNFWWAEGPISAPNPNSGIEAACGW